MHVLLETLPHLLIHDAAVSPLGICFDVSHSDTSAQVSPHQLDATTEQKATVPVLFMK